MTETEVMRPWCATRCAYSRACELTLLCHNLLRALRKFRLLGDYIMRCGIISVLLLLAFSFYDVSHAAQAQKNPADDILAALEKQNTLLSAQNEYLSFIFLSMCIAQNNKRDYCLKIVRDIQQRNKVAHEAPHKTSQWDIDKANCEIFARRNARGSGRALLHMFTRNEEVQALIDACMKSKGYKIAEKKGDEEQEQGGN